MKLSSLARLVGLSLERDRRGALFSAFGVAMGVGALVFFLALGLGVGRLIERIFPMDARMVEVVPPAVSLGSLLGGGRLDDAMVERLRALPGVEQVYRKMNVRVPATSRYEGDFFGRSIRMRMDVPATGVDPGLLQQDVQMGRFEDPGPDKQVPGMVSTRLLEIYNHTFAPARGLPRLAPGMIAGFALTVDFNTSFVSRDLSGPPVPVQVQVVGASDRAMLGGLTVPLEVARRLNRQLQQDADTYTAVTVVAKSPSEVPRLVAAAREMGLEIDEQERRMAQNVGAAVALTTSALALLSLLICVLAAVNIAHALSAAVRARAREIGVMQAVGASRFQVRLLFLTEAGVVGVVGGALGTLVARLVALGMDRLAARYLPSLPFQPESFFHFPLPVLLGGVGLGLVAALAGAWFPSRRAAATDPARTLAG